jgi:hypothetical protein
MRWVGGLWGDGVGWARLLALGACVLGCGRTAHQEAVGDVGSDDGSQQVLVPASIEKPGAPKYFVVNDDVLGPELVRFGDEDEPRVVSLAPPDGRYHSFEGRWSPSGNRYLYSLVANVAGIPAARLMQASLDEDFTPRELGDAELARHLQRVAWIGDDVALAQTHDALHDGYVGHYYWIDVASGDLTDLGELPPGDNDTPPVEFSRGAWPSRFGLAYLDRDCTLSYREDLGDVQTLSTACDLSAEWSPDGSLLLVRSQGQHALYRREHGRLQSVLGVSDALRATPSQHFNWAPGSSRFVAYSGGNDGALSITTLAVIDGETDSYTELAELPVMNYIAFANDNLLIGAKWGSENYAATVDGISSGRTALTPLGQGDNPNGLLAASSDSSYVYYAKDPFIELELDDGRPGRSRELFNEPRPVVAEQFRLFDDNAGLLTLFEADIEKPGGGASTDVTPCHQYLLRLGSDAAVIPLGSFNLAAGTDAVGIETFQSAPAFGGIFYVTTGARGHVVEWLGFDDIARKKRLVEYTGALAGVSFPSRAGNP